MKTVTIKIRNSCKIPSLSTKALVFSTKNGKNGVFSIPLSQIIDIEESLITSGEINFPAKKITITSWIYSKIEGELNKMSHIDYELISK